MAQYAAVLLLSTQCPQKHHFVMPIAAKINEKILINERSLLVLARLEHHFFVTASYQLQFRWLEISAEIWKLSTAVHVVSGKLRQFFPLYDLYEFVFTQRS
jgi:hypothetical protein